MAVSEMMSANPETWGTDKSLKRMYLADEPGIRAVQIVGIRTGLMADAARRSVSEGAQIVDINMGCPAKRSTVVWPVQPCCKTLRWCVRFANGSRCR